MELIRYSNADYFIEDNYQFLFANEAANNLIIGIANGVRSRKIKGDVLMCSVKAQNNILLSSVMTPPRDLIVACSEADEQVISLFINNLIANKTELPGILAENKFANSFCKKWNERTGDKTKLFRKERAYQLQKCRELKVSPGQMRLATKDDRDLISGWIKEFHYEINEIISDESAQQMSEMKIASKEVFIWIDGEIVSMCASDRESQKGKVINLVYTPLRYRRKGYATSCVYNLCERILREGKTFCCLFTDLDNQTSNNIYSNIGFNPILDLLHYRFEK